MNRTPLKKKAHGGCRSLKPLFDSTLSATPIQGCRAGGLSIAVVARGARGLPFDPPKRLWWSSSAFLPAPPKPKGKARTDTCGSYFRRMSSGTGCRGLKGEPKCPEAKTELTAWECVKAADLTAATVAMLGNSSLLNLQRLPPSSDTYP